MAFFGMVEPDESAMIAHVWSPQAMAECRVPDKPFRFPTKTAGLWADPIRNREPVIVNDYSSVLDKRGLPNGHVPITRFLGVPIIENGKVIAVAGTANRMADYGDRHIVRLRLITSTITDFLSVRRKAQALRESEETHRALVEGLPDVVMRFDREGRHLFVSDNVRKTVNMDAKQFIGKTHGELGFPEAQCRFWEDSIRRVFDTGASLETEFTLNGDKLLPTVHNWRLVPERDARGAVSSVLSISRDITAHRQAEQEYRTLFREMMDGFAVHEIICDAAGTPVDYRFLAVNPAFERITGLTAEAVVGKTVLEVMPSTERYWIETYGKVAFSGEPVIFENYSAELGRHFQIAAFRPAPSQFACIFEDITVRKQAEEALRESEEKFRLLHEAAGVGIGYYTPDGIVVSYNCIAARYMGGAPEEFTGKSIHELFPPDQANQFFSRIKIAAESSHWQRYEDCVELPTGDMWFQSIFTRVINSKDQIVGVQIISIEITEAKRAEQEIRRNSERLKAMVEISQHRSETRQMFLDHALDKAIALTGSQLGYIYFYNEERQEFELNSWSKSVMRECLVANPQTSYQLEKTGIWGEAVRQRKPLILNEFWADNPLKKGYPEGHVSLTRFLTIPVFYRKRIVAVVGVANKPSDYNEIDTLELTLLMDSVWKTVESLKKEEALKESEERFRLTYSTSPDAININRLEDGLYVDVNEGFTRLTGFTREDVIGRTSSEINIWRNLEDRKKLVQGLKQRGYYENLEAQFTKKDGGFTTALMSARVISLDGAPHILSITRDISDRIRTEKEKEKLQDQLQQAHKMEAVGTLAGGIAHDFNNLLQAINGYTQLLLMDKSEKDPEHHSLKAIQDAGFRAADLVRQLLLFSRKAGTEKRPIELPNEVERAKKMLERTIPKMIEIQVYFGTRLWTINADPVQIEQMLLNLGTNAADAMPEGGKLLFEIENTALDNEYTQRHLGAQPGHYVLLSVSDTGHGMDKETLEKIFDPFFTTKEFGKGTGLGLASVYGIVKGHGGYITCYSEIGQGTTFKIYFPAIVQPKVEESREAEVKPIPRGTEAILLVDDEDAIRGFAQQALLKFGYSVLTASTGEEALKVYSTKLKEIDLVIMDLGMPGMGGHKCLQEIFSMKPSAKVIIASGYSINGQARKTMESGAKGFVGKPYELADLLNKIREVLDSHS
jgi:PAS domain S-box-containing protein